MAAPRALNGKHAVVTGAASGIGRATAIELARRGARVTVVDVDARGLAETAARIGATSHVVDLADGAAIERFARDAGDVDVLVSNAGIAVVAPFERTRDDDWERLLAVNLRASITLTRALLPSIRARRGALVYVASLAGLIAAPGMVAYSTTKFALVGFAESLRLELAETGVDVTTVCPGYVRTGLHAATRYENDGFRRFLDAPPRFYGLTAARAAAEIADAIEARRALLVLGPERVGFWLKRAAPTTALRVTRWIAKRAGVASP